MEASLHSESSSKRNKTSFKALFSTKHINVRQEWLVDESERPHKSAGKQTNSSSGHERHPSWSELIFDLIIVASLSALGEGLSRNLASEHLYLRYAAPFLYLCQYAPIFYHWFFVDTFINRFGLEGAVGMLTIFAHILSIGMMNIAIMQLNDAESNEERSMAISYYAYCNVAANGLEVLESSNVFYMTPHKYQASVMMLFHCLVSLLWLVIALFTSNLVFVTILWVLILLLNQYVFVLYRFIGKHVVLRLAPDWPAQFVPIHIDLASERNGLLVMIALGESFMSTLAVAEFSFETFLRVLLAAGHAFIIKIMYIDVMNCIGEDVVQHALKNATCAARYLHGHFWVILGITLSARILEAHKEHVSEDRHIDSIMLSQRVLFGLSIGMLVCSIWVVGTSHKHALDGAAKVSLRVRSGMVLAYCVMVVLGTALVPWRDQIVMEAVVLASMICIVAVEGFCRHMHLNDDDEAATASEHVALQSTVGTNDNKKDHYGALSSNAAE